MPCAAKAQTWLRPVARSNARECRDRITADGGSLSAGTFLGKIQPNVIRSSVLRRLHAVRAANARVGMKLTSEYFKDAFALLIVALQLPAFSCRDVHVNLFRISSSGLPIPSSFSLLGTAFGPRRAGQIFLVRTSLSLGPIALL